MARRIQTLRYLVGIDFSLSSSGISMNDGVSIKTLVTKPVPKPPKQQNTKRLHQITDQILHHIFDPFSPRLSRKDTFIFLEDYAYGGMGKTFDIAECVGILKYKLHYTYKLPLENLFLVSIPHLKMFCCGKGNATKDTVIKEVFKRWGYDTNNNNKADAFVLMQIAMSFFEESKYLPSFQKEALKRIREYNAKDKNKKSKK